MSSDRIEILQGTLDLLILKTLAVMGPMHGWGIGRRLEQISDNSLYLNQGTIYPALLRLQQRRWIRSDWGISENNRRARFYEITRAGRKQLQKETKNWRRMAAIVGDVLGEAS